MPLIFIIEDDEYLGRVYERAFHFANYTVELVRDGELALTKLQAADPVPAAVVLDIKIPKLDGFELLQALRRDPRYADVPVVVLTNSIVEEDRQRFMAAGADLYLTKIEEKTKDVVEKIQEMITKGREVISEM